MSNKRLTAELILSTIDKATGPLKKVMQGSQHTANALKEARQTVRNLNSQMGDVRAYRKARYELNLQAKQVQFFENRLSSATKETEEHNDVYNKLKSQLRGAQKRYKFLIKEFDKGQGSSQEFRMEIDRTRIEIDKMQEKVHQSYRRLTQLRGVSGHAKTELKRLAKQNKASSESFRIYRDKLDSAGIGTDRLVTKNRRLKQSLEDANTAFRNQQLRLERLNKLHAEFGAVNSAASNVRSRAGSLMTQATVAGAAGGFFFKTQFLDTAAAFEDYKAVLKTVERSETKAAEALQWTSDFAAKTPYALAEVTEAYVQLRSYGLEPTNGLLQTLGDTSAAMNKPILQSVEAIADAVAGENERLKEFGILASKSQGLITYDYTDSSGQQRQMTASADNRREIEETLSAIWNDKYSGAMEERSKTWTGMISNMSDQWTRFTNMIMAAGMFDWMKNKLGGFLSTLDQMAADGTLQAYAKDIGDKLVGFAEGVWAAGTAISNITSLISNMVGGWENLIYILTIIKLAPLIASIYQLGAALLPLVKTILPMLGHAILWVGKAFLTNPIGIAVAAIAGAAYLIYRNWEPIKAFFGNLWAQVQEAFSGGIAGIGALLLNWSPIGILYSVIQKGLSALGLELPAKFTEFGGNLIQGLIDGLTARIDLLKDSVTSIGSSISGWFKDVLGIRSPSRVFAEHGLDVMAGLQQGLGNGEVDVIGSMVNIGNRLLEKGRELANKLRSTLGDFSNSALERLGAAGGWVRDRLGLGQSDLTPATAGIQFDNRPALQPRSSNGSGSVSIGEIHVHAAPGMDAEAVARMVAMEIQKLQRQQAASTRSQLRDED